MNVQSAAGSTAVDARPELGHSLRDTDPQVYAAIGEGEPRQAGRLDPRLVALTL